MSSRPGGSGEGYKSGHADDSRVPCPVNAGASAPRGRLIAVCARDNRRGLLLVEAKAHESELDWKGKRALNAETDSPQAWANDGRIRAAIAEAQDWFAQVAGPTTLTADSHYQLANRLASAYKVASVGVPVVLLYLGFIGDTYFGDYLRDADHWQQLMRRLPAGCRAVGPPRPSAAAHVRRFAPQRRQFPLDNTSIIS